MNTIKMFQKNCVKASKIRDNPKLLFSYALKSEEVLWRSDALSKDPFRTFVRVLEFAEAGDVVSQNQIGFWFAHGITVFQNGAIAVNWYEKAVHGGNSKALSNLAVHYLGGLDVPVDTKRGIHLLKNSMNTQDPRGFFWMAQCYRLGLGIGQSEHCAQECFFMAKERGCEEAKYYLKGNSQKTTSKKAKPHV